MNSKSKGLLWLGVAALFATTLGLGLPYFARHIPWPVEKRMARFLGGLPDADPCRGARHPEAKDFLDQIVRRLYPLGPEDATFPVSVEAVRGPTINAFATLGGKIYVFEGLIKQAESAEELAGVLAHEIEHVRRRHIMQGVFVRLVTVEALSFVFSGKGQMAHEVANMVLNLRFTHKQEEEADEGGLKRLRDAQIDVVGFEHFFERAENMSSLPSILSDHPSNENRARLAQRFSGGVVRPILDQRNWAVMKKICE